MLTNQVAYLRFYTSHNGIPPHVADYGSVRGVLLNIFSNKRVSLLVVRVISVAMV